MSIIVDLLSRTEAAAPITAAEFDTFVEAIEAAFADATADADFTPIETLANTALQPADIASGTITALPAALDLSGGADGEVLTIQADGSATWEAFPGGGDMLAATYDPQTIAGDAFALSTHTGTISNAQIGDGVVENDNIRDAAALSVIGRSVDSSGDVADISTTAASLHVLRESGGTIGFGALSTAYITSGTWADTRFAASNITQFVDQIDHDATLNFVANEHVDHSSVSLSAGTGISSTGLGNLTATRTINLADTAVTPDTYTLATVTIDQQGRITAASNGTGVDATGVPISTASGVLALNAATHGLHNNVTLTSDQASSVFSIDDDVAAGTWFCFAVAHDGCTVDVEGDAGSVNGTAGGSARLINGGHAFARVVSNAGTAPVVVVYGGVIVAPTEITSTKTYDLDDSNRVFVLASGAGTQTFNTAVASITTGYIVTIVNESGGNITIDGIDADGTLGDNEIAVVMKAHTSLLCFITGDAPVVLDAA